MLTEEPRLLLEAARHPVVERFIDGPFVPNDLSLHDQRRMLIITGPNMGGKSTYMRQVALIVLLAHIGTFVPARAARIGPIDRIFTRIGAADDLAGGRSTFMVEMTETANILHNATAASLVLMDEIGRGTSTFDGLALAYAVARRCARDSSVHAVRHPLLRAHGTRKRDAACANVHLDATEHGEALVFLHAVKEGPANRSYGLKVAQLAGVPPEVIASAQRYLTHLEAHSIAPAAGGQQSLPLRVAPPPAAPQGRCPTGAAADSAAIHRLRKIDPDTLTPRAALDLLYQLKRLSDTQ